MKENKKINDENYKANLKRLRKRSDYLNKNKN